MVSANWLPSCMCSRYSNLPIYKSRSEILTLNFSLWTYGSKVAVKVTFGKVKEPMPASSMTWLDSASDHWSKTKTVLAPLILSCISKSVSHFISSEGWASLTRSMLKVESVMSISARRKLLMVVVRRPSPVFSWTRTLLSSRSSISLINRR